MLNIAIPTEKSTFFTSAQQPAGPNSQKNTEKLGATPNQRIKRRESGFVVVQTPFILSLTPKPKHPSPPNSGQIFEKSDGFTSVFCPQNVKKWRIYYCIFDPNKSKKNRIY